MNVRLFPLILSLLLPLSALAQTDATDEASEPVPFYDVEIVLFKNLQGPRGLEYNRPSSLPVKTDNTVEIQSKDSINAAAELGYELLEEDEFRLIEQVEKIIRSSRYELMLHAAWRQPGLQLEQSTPIWIRGGNLFGNEYSSIDFRPASELSASQIANAIDNSENEISVDEDGLATEQRELDAILELDETAEPEVMPTIRTVEGLYELEGKITVSLSRFLHVNADLVMRKPRASGYNQGTVYSNQSRQVQDSKILENHRLRERRRMRSATLHYLDNPQFSMLVIISKYEPEEPAAEETIDTASVVTPLAE